MKKLKIHDLLKNTDLEIIYRPEGLEEISVSGIEINRPGLQMTGFYKHFVPGRIQVLGEQEKEYLLSLDEVIRRERIERLFEYPIPAFIIANNIFAFPDIKSLAEKHDVLLLKSKLETTKFISKLLGYMEEVLAPKITLHGVLLEVFGMGVLMTGKSGVGKSETALELIKRGHRLVADDAVEIKRIEEMLRGTSPAVIRHFMELRGIGILDIKRLYGVGAVKNWEFLDLVVELEHWDEQKEYDRVGMDEKTMDILGMKIPRVTVPVQPGRNLAMIVEVAARNARQKQFGYNAALELDKKLKDELKRKKEALK